MHRTQWGGAREALLYMVLLPANSNCVYMTASEETRTNLQWVVNEKILEGVRSLGILLLVYISLISLV